MSRLTYVNSDPINTEEQMLCARRLTKPKLDEKQLYARGISKVHGKCALSLIPFSHKIYEIYLLTYQRGPEGKQEKQRQNQDSMMSNMERERSSSFHWITAQMAAMARAGPY